MKHTQEAPRYRNMAVSGSLSPCRFDSTENSPQKNAPAAALA